MHKLNSCTKFSDINYTKVVEFKMEIKIYILRKMFQITICISGLISECKFINILFVCL